MYTIEAGNLWHRTSTINNNAVYATNKLIDSITDSLKDFPEGMCVNDILSVLKSPKNDFILTDISYNPLQNTVTCYQMYDAMMGVKMMREITDPDELDYLTDTTLVSLTLCYSKSSDPDNFVTFVEEQSLSILNTLLKSQHVQKMALKHPYITLSVLCGISQSYLNILKSDTLDIRSVVPALTICIKNPSVKNEDPKKTFIKLVETKDKVTMDELNNLFRPHLLALLNHKP